MAVIKGYTELIENKFGDTMDQELKRLLHFIKNNIERLETCTERVMNMESLLE